MSRTLAVVFAGFCAFLTLFATQPLLPAFEAIFHASKVAVSLTVTAATLGVALAAPLIGTVADRLGRKHVIVWSAYLLAASTVLAATATNLPALLFGDSSKVFSPPSFCYHRRLYSGRMGRGRHWLRNRSLRHRHSPGRVHQPGHIRLRRLASQLADVVCGSRHPRIDWGDGVGRVASSGAPLCTAFPRNVHTILRERPLRNRNLLATFFAVSAFCSRYWEALLTSPFISQRLRSILAPPRWDRYSSSTSSVR